MNNYNQFEEYMLNNINLSKYTLSVIIRLSFNPCVSIKFIIEICNKFNINFKKYIIHNENLTIDDIELYDIKITQKLLEHIAQYCDIFSNNNIQIINNLFYYKGNELPLKYIKYNKYLLESELYKYPFISINYYVCCNPNGNFLNYVFSNVDDLINGINYYNGIYNKKIEEIILQYKNELRKRINRAVTYLPYEFIIENNDLFVDNYGYKRNLCCNKSLTINNVMDILKNCDSENGCYIFMYSNITIQDILNNNLHNSEYFHYFARNINCSIDDIENNSHLNWTNKLVDILSSNERKYNNDVYKFKFIE
jgi:hypothetical protein